MISNHMLYVKTNDLLRTIDLPELAGYILVRVTRTGITRSDLSPSELAQLPTLIVYTALTRLAEQFKPVSPLLQTEAHRLQLLLGDDPNQSTPVDSCESEMNQ